MINLFLNPLDGWSEQAINFSPGWSFISTTSCTVKVKTLFSPLSCKSVTIRNDFSFPFVSYVAAVNEFTVWQDHNANWTSFWYSQLYAMAKSTCYKWHLPSFLSCSNYHAWFAWFVLSVHAFETGETVHIISLWFHQKDILKFLVLISFDHYNLILYS